MLTGRHSLLFGSANESVSPPFVREGPTYLLPEWLWTEWRCVRDASLRRTTASAWL